MLLFVHMYLLASKKYAVIIDVVFAAVVVVVVIVLILLLPLMHFTTFFHLPIFKTQVPQTTKSKRKNSESGSCSLCNATLYGQFYVFVNMHIRVSMTG